MKNYTLTINENANVKINYDRFKIYLSLNEEENASYLIESTYYYGDEEECSNNSLLEAIVGPWYDLSWETKEEAERTTKEAIKTGSELDTLIFKFLDESIPEFIELEAEAVRHEGLNLYYEVLISDCSTIKNAQESFDNIYKLWKDEIIDLEGIDNFKKFKFENFFDIDTLVLITKKLGDHVAFDFKTRKVVASSLYKEGE